MKRTISMLIAGTALCFGALAQAANSDEVVLQRRVEAASPRNPATNYKWQQQVAAIGKFKAQAEAGMKLCADAKRVSISDKYVLSYDAAGKPCRIYDLSFPTLKSTFERVSVSQLPVQKLKAKDYLNWIDGNYGAVYQRMDTFNKNFNSTDSLKDTWVSELKFKSQPKMVAGSKGNGLPASFYASDLDLGMNFQFSSKDRAAIHSMLEDAKALRPKGVMPTPSELASDQMWATLADHPEKMLEKMRFDWNEARKVYEVFLEGDFFPIYGPLALVDYQVQYKHAAERLVRSVFKTALRGLANLVPNPIMSNLLDVAVTDTFEFVDMMYTYQGMALEDTLRTVTVANSTGIETMQLQTGLNILFGEQSDLLMAYIMSMAQGQAFDWTAIDKIGKTARYQAEKAREVAKINSFSRLTKEKGCTLTLVQENFANCAKNGENVALYSLMSEQKLLFWKLGPTKIHNEKMGSEIMLKRATAWLLSGGIRLFKIPYIPQNVNFSLAYRLQDFAMAGVLDESLLRSRLMRQHQSAPLSEQDKDLVSWLYIQHINPFLPKSPAAERGVIATNTALLNKIPLQ